MCACAASTFEPSALKRLTPNISHTLPPNSQELKSCAMPRRQETEPEEDARIERAALEAGIVPHFYDFLTSRRKVEYKICIPSYNRPDKLCHCTLTMLRRHSIDMTRVHVFVAPSVTPDQGRPEWSRYLRELRGQGYSDVHIEPGGDGLWGQMQAIFSWAHEDSYIVCMSDDVEDIVSRKKKKDDAVTRKPLPHGSLDAIFLHAWDMMRVGNFDAWGLSASKNILSMDENVISRKLGLLEGNFWGMIAWPCLSSLLKEPDVGVIYDVAFTTEFWASGRRFFRYRGLSAVTTYKTAGGLMTSMTKEQRRSAEDRQIRILSAKHPNLVQFKAKEISTLKMQQFSFTAQGPPPIRLQDPTPMTAGRRYEGHALRSMTPAERQRKHRRGLAAISLAMKRPARAMSIP